MVNRSIEHNVYTKTNTDRVGDKLKPFIGFFRNGVLLNTDLPVTIHNIRLYCRYLGWTARKSAFDGSLTVVCSGKYSGIVLISLYNDYVTIRPVPLSGWSFSFPATKIVDFSHRFVAYNLIYKQLKHRYS